MNKRQKKKQIKMKNKKLIKKYPFLLPRNVWTGKVPKYLKTMTTHIRSTTVLVKDGKLGLASFG